MRKVEEGGAFGSGVTRSYTFMFSLGALGALWQFVRTDLNSESSHLRVALGLQSSTGIWVVAIIALMFTSSMPIGVAAELYYRFTGLRYVEDRVGFAKSGGRDIGFWSGYLTLVAVVFVFATFVPAHWLGWGRSVAALLLSSFAGCWLCRIVARRVFTHLFGELSQGALA